MTWIKVFYNFENIEVESNSDLDFGDISCIENISFDTIVDDIFENSDRESIEKRNSEVETIAKEDVTLEELLDDIIEDSEITFKKPDEKRNNEDETIAEDDVTLVEATPTPTDQNIQLTPPPSTPPSPSSPMSPNTSDFSTPARK